MVAFSVEPASKNTIVGACRFLRKSKEDDRALRGDTNDNEDGQDDDEDGAEG